jgi:AcrR family transcriptional regulator
MPTRTGKQPLHSRKQPKQARSRQLVADIVEGAARVFDREGLSATTNRVAEEAGVSVGSLYQYFPNKQALLHALAERHVDSASRLLEQAAAQHADAATIEPFMRGMLHAVLQEHRDHSHLRPLLRTAGAASPDVERRLQACIADAQMNIVTLLQRLKPEVHNAELRARLVTSVIDGLIHHATGLDFDDAFEDEIVALCVRYLEH